MTEELLKITKVRKGHTRRRTRKVESSKLNEKKRLKDGYIFLLGDRILSFVLRLSNGLFLGQPQISLSDFEGQKDDVLT